MGWNSTVVVMNDALDSIKEDPKFGENLASAVTHLSVLKRGEHVDVPARNHCNAATVIEQHHADGLHAILVGGNYGQDLGYVGGYSLDVKDEDGARRFLRQIADNLGFEVAIKPKRKRA